MSDCMSEKVIEIYKQQVPFLILKILICTLSSSFSAQKN